MQVEDERSRIFRSNNWTRRNKNRKRKSEECIGLTDTKVCQGHLEVFGISELLSPIHSGLCNYSQTII